MAPAAVGYAFFTTALGECALAWTGDAIAAVQLPESSHAAGLRRLLRRHPGLAPAAAVPPHADRAMARIAALFEGSADDLCSIALDMTGVPEFHQRVYRIARAIPPGRTLSYGDVARQLGDLGAARAVGRALGHNPFAPVVPCHRVLAAGSRSGGFSAAGGVATKLRMLQIEGARFGVEPGLFDGAPAD